MDLQVIILSGLRKRKAISYDVTYMENLKTDTNELMKQEQTHRLCKQRYGCHRGKVGGGRDASGD